MKHNIFYVSLLKPVEEHPQKPSKLILMKDKREWLINFIIDKCVYERKHITQYQIQWKGYDSYENT